MLSRPVICTERTYVSATEAGQQSTVGNTVTCAVSLLASDISKELMMVNFNNMKRKDVNYSY